MGLEPLPQETLNLLREAMDFDAKHEQELNQFVSAFPRFLQAQFEENYRDETPGSGRSRAFYPSPLCLIAPALLCRLQKKQNPPKTSKGRWIDSEQSSNKLKPGKRSSKR